MLKNIWFLCEVSIIFASEGFFYWLSNDFDDFIEMLTYRLAKVNILYVKIFQAIALNNKLIDERINQQLLRFTDHAPWSENDVDANTLIRLVTEDHIFLENGFYNPINAGMISLVYKTYLKSEKKMVIIKLKRKNIEQKLEESINRLIFFVHLISSFSVFPVFSFLKQYQIPELIQTNIDLIRHQVDFTKELANMEKMRENCKHLKYIRIPDTYSEMTEKYPNLIMMECMEGQKIGEVLEEDYEGFAKQVLKFGLVTTLVHGFSHGDLHAGNLFFITDFQDTKNPYKLAILDFGIMYEIKECYRAVLFDLIHDLFTQPVEETAQKMLDSGMIFQPLEVIQQLPQEHYQTILMLMSIGLNEVLHKTKDGNQMKLYDFIFNFHSYMKNTDLRDYGLRFSDDFVKNQLVLAMAQGVTLKLCKENYIDLANQVCNELFHLDLLTTF